MRMPRTVLTMILLCSAIGCAPQKPGSEGSRQVRTSKGGEKVIEVGRDGLSVEEYEARTASLRAFQGEGAEEPFAAVVAFELLADEAERRGYGNDPRVVNEVKDALADEISRGGDREALAKTLREKAEVSIDEPAMQRAFENVEKK